MVSDSKLDDGSASGTGKETSEQKFPLGWDAERVKRLADHYDGLSEQEQAAEDDAVADEQTGDKNA